MTEEQRMAELMKPRYKVIADYPDSPFWVGSILIFIPRFMHRVDGNIESTTYSDVFRRGNHFILADEIKEYPHLFKRLEWWEDRKPGEMPEYVKDERGQFFKIMEWDGSRVPYIYVDTKVHTGFNESCTESVLYLPYYPATFAEYQQYINSKQQP